MLAVDDDPTIQRLLQVNLEMEGYRVILAADGVRALATARRERPDLILLDVMMPELDGWEVCRRVREDPDLAGVPVVFLSARAQEGDILRGSRSGADAYITKPFDPIELLELIEDLLS